MSGGVQMEEIASAKAIASGRVPGKLRNVVTGARAE